MGKLLFVDCETGGTNSEKDALLQLSGIIEVGNKVVSEIDLKMKPLPGKCVSTEALEIQGRTMEDVEKFDNPIECFNKFYNFLSIDPKNKSTRFVTAGYNVDFDLRFICEWFRVISGGPYKFWDYLQFSPIDILPTLRAMRYAGIIDIKDTKLGTVCKYYNIPIEAHDSMSDIRATRILTKKIYGELWRGLDSNTIVDDYNNGMTDPETFNRIKGQSKTDFPLIK